MRHARTDCWNSVSDETPESFALLVCGSVRFRFPQAIGHIDVHFGISHDIIKPARPMCLVLCRCMRGR
jgi:hypothetical protein